MNTGARGRVVDEHGSPVEGLVVEAWDADVGPTDDFLGRAVTDGDGRFALTYPAEAYRSLLDRRPDLYVRVFDRRGVRELARSRVFMDRSDRVFAFPEVRVARASVAGWAVTLGGTEPSRLSRGNRVDFLVDDEQFTAFAEAVEGARRSVNLMQLFFPPRFVARFPGGDPGAPGAEPRDRLLRILLEAGRRGVRVRILLSENAVVRDDVDEVRASVRERDVPNVEVRSFPLSPQAMHGKLILVDERDAFLVGPPFQQKFWDTPEHLPRDARRGNDRPTHDVTMRLRGPAVAHAFEAFALLWNRRSEAEHGGRDTLAPIAPPPPAGEDCVQFVRTLPREVFPDAPGGERGILEAYLRALSEAQSLVYIENQYFTNPTVVHGIKAALDAAPELEVVMVLNETVDIPTYVQWQRVRTEELGHPGHPRLGAFVLGRPERRDGRLVRAAPVYVHSKFAVVDDAWLTAGNANLDSISLEAADEWAVKVPSNVEFNAVVLDGVAGAPRTGTAAAFRRRLWSEHLGVPVAELVERPPAGWLPLWRRIADANLARLRAGDPKWEGRALPYLPGERLTFSTAAPG